MPPSRPSPPASAATPRTRREPADRRRELLGAAAREADAHGLEALAPAAVAARAGASKALVFHYFGSTVGLRRAVALEAVAELERAIVTDRAAGERPVLAVAAFLDTVEARRRVWLDLWRGTLGGDEATQAALAAVRTGLVARVTTSTAAAVGGEPSSRLELVAGGFVALVENVAAAWLGGSDLTRRDVQGLLLASAVVLVPELPEPARSAVAAIARANAPGAG